MHCAAFASVRFSSRMSPRLDLGPHPQLGYTDSRIDRAADRRTDEAALAAFAADPRARAYVIGIDWIVMKAGAPVNEPAFTLDEARALGPATETVFLGLEDGAARFGIGLPAAAAEALKTRDGFHVTDLRSVAVQGLCDAAHLPAIAEAKAVLHWHARHRFCSNCGAPTSAVQAGWRRDCPECKGHAFPAHRPGGDHALGRRRALPARAQPALRADHVVVPGRLHRAGRVVRGRGAARDLGGSRHRHRPRRLFPLAAVAVSDVADDRLLRRGDHPRHRGGPHRARGCALVQQG